MYIIVSSHFFLISLYHLTFRVKFNRISSSISHDYLSCVLANKLVETDLGKSVSRCFPWFQLPMHLTSICRWNHHNKPTTCSSHSFTHIHSTRQMNVRKWKKRPIIISYSVRWHIQIIVFVQPAVKNTNIFSLQWYKIKKRGRSSHWRRQNLRTTTNKQQTYTHSTLPATSLYGHLTFNHTFMSAHWLSLPLSLPVYHKPHSTFLFRHTILLLIFLDYRHPGPTGQKQRNDSLWSIWYSGRRRKLLPGYLVSED